MLGDSDPFPSAGRHLALVLFADLGRLVHAPQFVVGHDGMSIARMVVKMLPRSRAGEFGIES
jgi:hypothetical protein